MQLREIMTTEVVGIGPEEAANTAWARMKSEGIHHLVVEEGEQLLGVLSDLDIGGPQGDALRRGKIVREFMSSPPVTATPETTLRQAANTMQKRLINCLPVLDDGRVVGIVTATDVLDALGQGPTPAGTRLGRERVRQPDSRKRAPFAGQIPRAEKRQAGRTTAAEVPAYIRAVGVELQSEDRDYVRRKLGRKLGKFVPPIERASVRIEDVNGPRGGLDKSCRIKIVLSRMPSVVVEGQHHELRAAVDAALNRAERTVRRALEGRRMA